MSVVLRAILPKGSIFSILHPQVLIVGCLLALLVCGILAVAHLKPKALVNDSNILTEFGRFFYASFLKPHSGDGVGIGQQEALESFYKAQASLEPVPLTARADTDFI